FSFSISIACPSNGLLDAFCLLRFLNQSGTISVDCCRLFLYVRFVPLAVALRKRFFSFLANSIASLAVFNCARDQDRKSTRLNSSHVSISYAVFCLKKKK